MATYYFVEFTHDDTEDWEDAGTHAADRETAQEVLATFREAMLEDEFSRETMPNLKVRLVAREVGEPKELN